MVVAAASSENKASFTETAASGRLEFTDANTNTAFALVPPVTLAPGQTKTLLFAAAFDNTVLHLAPGTPARVETIVSFGNAAPGAVTATNLDINGSGGIESTEARVRSVPARLGGTVPAEVPGTPTVTLSDTLDDLVATDTVTFSNPTFTLGATGGTVSVTYAGGTAGGTLTNCAHLTGTNLTLQACNTETIAPHVCTPGAAGCGWADGDMVTYAQGSWDSGAGYNVLTGNYDAVYASNFGVVEVGIPGSGGFSMQFSSWQSVVDYVPSTGPFGALTADLLDPTTTSSGPFGGDVLSLQIDVDFSDAGVLGGSAGLKFGDLTLCGFTTMLALNGMTVRQFLATVNTMLGGGSGPYSIADLDLVTHNLTGAFGVGAATAFAQAHVVNGACP